MEVLTPEVKKQYLQGLEQRRAMANRVGQIDNSSLYAGSPMHYYCRHCGLATETLPETHLSSPKRVCDDCKTMIEAGWQVTLGCFPGDEPTEPIFALEKRVEEPESRQQPM